MPTTQRMCRRRHITVLREPYRSEWASTAPPDKVEDRLTRARQDLADLTAEVTWLTDLLQQQTRPQPD